MGSLPPFLILIVGALLVPLFRGPVAMKLRGAFMLALPVLGALNLWWLRPDAAWSLEVFGYPLALARFDAAGEVDQLSFIFGLLFHLAAFIGTVFALHVKEATQHLAALAYAGSAVGAAFAGDMITLFVFWELLAVTSVFLIWGRKTERAYGAGMRYLLVNMVSGLLLLSGILLRAHETGSVAFDRIGLAPLGETGGLASWLIFLAFGIKCAFPFLHNWLTDAYPEATPTGTVFLSAFTTKVAVYAFARAFPGQEELIWIGTAMAAFPIFFAVIENDLRRVLGYSMINQIGFMVVGVGVGGNLGINGAVAHAFNDVLFKGLLMMSMGAVLYRTGEMRGSELGGMYKSMPITTGFCMVGAASISAFPLFSGFVSKSMIMVAAAEQHHTVTWFILLFASAGVFHHAGIKIPFFAFFAHDSGKRCKEAPLHMLIAMGLAAFLCVFNGSYPALLYSLLPLPNTYVPYDMTHVVTQLQILFYSAGAFTFLMLAKLYPPELKSVNIDAEWVYRKGAKGVMALLHGPLGRAAGAFQSFVLSWLPRRCAAVARDVDEEEREVSGWLTGTSLLVAMLVLLAYLIMDIVRS